MRKILAMKFQLESNEGKIVELIASIQRDGNGKYLCPAHPSRTLLEVTAGDVLAYKRSSHLLIKRLNRGGRASVKMIRNTAKWRREPLGKRGSLGW